MTSIECERNECVWRSSPVLAILLNVSGRPAAVSAAGAGRPTSGIYRVPVIGTLPGVPQLVRHAAFPSLLMKRLGTATGQVPLDGTTNQSLEPGRKTATSSKPSPS